MFFTHTSRLRFTNNFSFNFKDWFLDVLLSSIVIDEPVDYITILLHDTWPLRGERVVAGILLRFVVVTQSSVPGLGLVNCFHLLDAG